MKQQLIIERQIMAPVERVWQALTNIGDLKKWLSFLPDFEAKVGFKTEFDLGPDAEHKYHHYLEVTEVVERQRLSYTWDYGGMSKGSSVTFDLTAAGDNTRLVLTCYIEHVPSDDPDFMKNAKMGWNFTADGLKQYAEKIN